MIAQRAPEAGGARARAGAIHGSCASAIPAVPVAAEMWALLLGSALAAGRIALPAGEASAGWTESLRTAGLTLAATPEGADVTLTDLGATWRVVLRGGATLEVREPKTAAEREDLAMLLASLARPADPLDWRSLPPPPPPARPRPRPPRPPRPAPPVAPPRPTMQPEPQQIAGAAPLALMAVPVELSSAAPLGLPEPLAHARRPRPTPWVALSLAGSARVDLAPTPGLELAIGLERPRWRLGVAAGLDRAAALTSLSGARTERAIDAALGLWARPLPALDLGLLGGADYRTWAQDDAVVQRAIVPVLGLDLRADLPLVGPLALVPELSVRRDLLLAAAIVGDAEPVPLSPWTWSAGLGLRLRGGDRVLELSPP